MPGQDSIKAHLCLKSVEYLIAAGDSADLTRDGANDSVGDVDLSVWLVELDGDLHVRSPMSRSHAHP